MADRWMDERDRDWRDRDWRRSEQYNRDQYERDQSERGGRQTPRWGEDRSWAGAADDERGPYDYRGRPDRDRDYGQGSQDYGSQDYDAPSRLSYGGAAYGAGRGYGGGERQRGGAARFERQDYTGGADRERASRPYDRGYTGLGDRNTWERDGDRSYNRDLERRYADEMRHQPSGGTGGYDYERGYGDAGRGRDPNRPMFEEQRHEDRDRGGQGGGQGGDFLQRAGERISSWFRGDHLMRGSRDDDRGDENRYREDFGREARFIPDPGHRGMGPRGYRRSDERISDDVHQRLTDDSYLDASNIHVDVKDGEVTLSGTVDNREGKHRAERLIEDLSGVSHVQNNLRVQNAASLTGSGRGYGSSALEAEMRRNARETDPGNNGASGLSGRTSTGAMAERSTGTRTDSESGGV